MSNRKRIFFCKIVVFILLLAAGFGVLTQIFRDKTECEYVANFSKESKNSLDVIFLGSSQVIYGMQPMQLWNDYGITSYNLGASGTNIPTTYYLAKMAIREQHPKVIVADMSFIDSNKKTLGTERFHSVFDNFSWSIEKYEAVRDLIEPNKQLEMLFPLYIYHTRWKSLTEKDFKPIDDLIYTKGAKLMNTTYPMTYTCPDTDLSESKDIEPVAKEYIDKLIQLCKENNVSLVMTLMPLEYTAEDADFQKYVTSLQKLADENQIPLINGYSDASHWNLDYHTDFIDPAHVNFRGSKKVTDLLGTYLSEHYKFTDKRKNPEFKKWNQTLEVYNDYKSSLVNYAAYNIGDTISFQTDGNAGSYFTNGILPSEGAFSWSSGRQSDAFFLLSENYEKKAKLSMCLYSAYQTDQPYQDIEVYLNDQKIGTQRINIPLDSSKLEFNIDSTVLKKGLNHLTIKYKNILTEASETDKCIAIAYQSISIN